MTGVLLCLWVVLWMRIGVIQGFRHDRYVRRVVDQSVKPVTLTARRGTILDRNGVQLALNLSSFSYGIRPDSIEDRAAALASLRRATGMSEDRLRVTLNGSRFGWLVRQADPAMSDRLDKLDLSGLEKIPETRRMYLFGGIGAQVIGYTDIDNHGIEGCEIHFDDELTGRDGRSQVLRDALGKAARSVSGPDVAAQNGCDVVLSLDWRIQEIAGKEVADCVERFDAEWGGAIVLDPATGEILAMSNIPEFDPNMPGSFDPGVRRNRLVTDMIEPGSTFKIVVFAEALESGVVTEDDLIDCEGGRYRIAGHTINDTHELAVVPAADVFVHSSNIGSVKIAERVGPGPLYRRARQFGFGAVTGIAFPSETAGNMPHPQTWSGLSLPTISFGQGVAVSPLQLAMAYGAVANGGTLMRPLIIREVIGGNDRPGRTFEPQVIRRVMEETTARRLTALLTASVEEGTGGSAALPNIRIAGKTGTAQRPREDGRGYEPGRYVSSFVGFVEDREPRLVLLVMIDNPKGQYYGSQVAAPVFRRIMNRIVNMGDGPFSRQGENGPPVVEPVLVATVPDVRNMSVAKASARLSRLGLSPEVVGNPTTVARQTPSAGARLGPGGTVILYSEMIEIVDADHVKMPDLRGKTVREAVQNLVENRLEVNVEGSGLVRRQTPAPGRLVKLGTLCIIACGR